jgi:Pectate lyase superfamily protein
MSISDRQVPERQCKRALVSAEGYLILRRTILNRDLAGRFVGLVALLAWTLVAAEPRLSVFDPTAYGAKGDGRTNDGPAIQKAIDACARAGGGTVRLPAGNFLSGTLVLKGPSSPRPGRIPARRCCWA